MCLLETISVWGAAVCLTPELNPRLSGLKPLSSRPLLPCVQVSGGLSWQHRTAPPRRPTHLLFPLNWFQQCSTVCHTVGNDLYKRRACSFLCLSPNHWELESAIFNSLSSLLWKAAQTACPENWWSFLVNLHLDQCSHVLWGSYQFSYWMVFQMSLFTSVNRSYI